MLRQRALTAALLGPLFVLAVLYLPSDYFAVFVAALVLIGAWEWSALANMVHGMQRARYLLTMLAIVSLLMLMPQMLLPVVVLGTAWWIYVAVGLWWTRTDSSLRYSIGGVALSGLFVLIPAWYALHGLHRDDQGPTMVLLLVAIVWIADIGAYFVGRALGKRKLAPALSPGKSVEGLLGGLMGVIVFAGIAAVWVLEFRGVKFVLWLVLVAVSALFSVVGDLFESYLKRRAGVKDSGTLLPGHGGMLDRIDSITAAAPVFYLGWQSLKTLDASMTA